MAAGQGRHAAPSTARATVGNTVTVATSRTRSAIVIKARTEQSASTNVVTQPALRGRGTISRARYQFRPDGCYAVTVSSIRQGYGMTSDNDMFACTNRHSASHLEWTGTYKVDALKPIDRRQLAGSSQGRRWLPDPQQNRPTGTLFSSVRGQLVPQCFVYVNNTPPCTLHAILPA
jgi:hypothetical protein